MTTFSFWSGRISRDLADNIIALRDENIVCLQQDPANARVGLLRGKCFIKAAYSRFRVNAADTNETAPLFAISFRVRSFPTWAALKLKLNRKSQRQNEGDGEIETA